MSETDYLEFTEPELMHKLNKMAHDGASSPVPCSADLIQAVLDCANEELQARLSGLENGFDHPNALVLFGRAKAIAMHLYEQNGAAHASEEGPTNQKEA